MAHPSLNPISAPHRGRADPLQPGALVYIRLADDQAIDINTFGLLFRIGYRRFQDFHNVTAGSLLGKAKDRESLIDIFAPNQIDDESDLLSGATDVFGSCMCFHKFHPTGVTAPAWEPEPELQSFRLPLENYVL
jgi:hypothetical protein